MDKNFIIIYFNNYSESSKGGFGDKILGLISCLMISKMMDMEFRVCWERDNINKYLSFKGIKSETFKNEENKKYFDHINFAEYFKKNKKNLFSYKYNIITIGYDISHFNIKNKEEDINNFYANILNLYNNLYKNILVPKSFINEEINKLSYNKNNYIVGIQFRMGDSYIKGIDGFSNLFNSRRKKETRNGIRKMLSNIKKKIFYKKYSVFITSDYYEIFSLSKEIFDDVIYYDGKISHSGKSKNNNFKKTLIDNIFLAKKCNLLFITSNSNFGRVSALARDSNEIFSIYGNKLLKKNLLTKNEFIFFK